MHIAYDQWHESCRSVMAIRPQDASNRFMFGFMVFFKEKYPVWSFIVHQGSEVCLLNLNACPHCQTQFTWQHSDLLAQQNSKLIQACKKLQKHTLQLAERVCSYRLMHEQHVRKRALKLEGDQARAARIQVQAQVADKERELEALKKSKK